MSDGCRTCRHLSEIDGMCALDLDGECTAPLYRLWCAKPVPEAEMSDAYKMGLEEGQRQITRLRSQLAAEVERRDSAERVHGVALMGSGWATSQAVEQHRARYGGGK